MANGIKKDKKRIAVFAICYSLIAVCLLTIIFSVVIFSVTKNDQAVDGFVSYSISDDRLKSEGIEKGDLIYSKKLLDYSSLKEGDIITFQIMNEKAEFLSVTDVITGMTLDEHNVNRVICYKVAGQNAYVHPNQVLGVYELDGETVGKLYANIGTLIAFMRTFWGYFLFTVLPAIISIGLCAFTIIYDYTYNKKRSSVVAEN